jgi:hypothetical protein
MWAEFRLRRAFTLLICVLIVTALAFGETPKKLPSMREQAEIQQQWLKLRLERVLPRLMRKHGVSMWLVICREYNEDPAFFSARVSYRVRRAARPSTSSLIEAERESSGWRLAALERRVVYGLSGSRS